MANAEKKKRIINSCQTCRTPICEGEPIYTSYKSQSSGFTSGPYAGKNVSQTSYQIGGYGAYYRGNQSSENWAQCAWCYDQWQAEVKVNNNFWRKWILGSILVVIVSMFAITIMLPSMNRNELNESESTSNLELIPWYKYKMFSIGSWNVPLLAFVIFFVGVVLSSILGAIFQPKVARYKIRKRPKKQKHN